MHLLLIWKVFFHYQFISFFSLVCKEWLHLVWLVMLFSGQFFHISCLPALHTPHLSLSHFNAWPSYLHCPSKILISVSPYHSQCSIFSSAPLQLHLRLFCQWHCPQFIQHSWSLYHTSLSLLQIPLLSQIIPDTCLYILFHFTQQSPILWTADPKDLYNLATFTPATALFHYICLFMHMYYTDYTDFHSHSPLLQPPFSMLPTTDLDLVGMKDMHHKQFPGYKPGLLLYTN